MTSAYKLSQACANLAVDAEKVSNGIQEIVAALDSVRTLLRREWRVIKDGDTETFVPVGVTMDDFNALKRIVGMDYPTSVIENAVKSAICKRKP